MLLGLDFETTGLCATENRVIEIGAILWDEEENSLVKAYSCIVDCGQTITPEIEGITGISNRIISLGAIGEDQAAHDLAKLVAKCDYIVAHNAEFEKKFLSALFERNDISKYEGRWIDSSVDLPFPDKIETRKLTHLAAEHNFVNPFPHRALPDVLTMLLICKQYSWDEIKLNADTPKIKIRAMTNYAERDKAKACGYRWDGDAKIWFKNIKITDYQKEEERANKHSFLIQEIK